MKRITAKALDFEIDAKCDKLYPIDPANLNADLKTIGFRLNKKQALSMAKLLLLCSEWESVDVTIYRKPRKDGTHQITITSMQQQ
jgi:hypothetical protein